MRESRHCRTRRPSGLLASAVPSWIMIPVLLAVPMSLPRCVMEVDLCAVDVPAGSHCALAVMGEAAGLGSLPCCVHDAAPEGPAPAAPVKADADLRVQRKAPAPAAPAVHDALAAPAEAAPPHVPAAVPAAPAVPLYTLLSTLLS